VEGYWKYTHQFPHFVANAPVSCAVETNSLLRCGLALGRATAAGLTAVAAAPTVVAEKGWRFRLWPLQACRSKPSNRA
jgi:CBS-domain-containing membrane protein